MSPGKFEGSPSLKRDRLIGERRGEDQRNAWAKNSISDTTANLRAVEKSEGGGWEGRTEVKTRIIALLGPAFVTKMTSGGQAKIKLKSCFWTPQKDRPDALLCPKKSLH